MARPLTTLTNLGLSCALLVMVVVLGPCAAGGGLRGFTGPMIKVSRNSSTGLQQVSLQRFS